MNLFFGFIAFLTYYLQRAMTQKWVLYPSGNANAQWRWLVELPKSSSVLIFRYKMDSYHKGDDQGPNFERLRIDIQHLCLDKV